MLMSNDLKCISKIFTTFSYSQKMLDIQTPAEVDMETTKVVLSRITYGMLNFGEVMSFYVN